MNTATATHRIQTLSALSIALLISGTTNASHKADAATDQQFPIRYQDAPLRASSCSGYGESRTIILNLGASRIASPCAGASSTDANAPAPIRLAKPLSGSPYMRSEDSIRYSF